MLDSFLRTKTCGIGVEFLEILQMGAFQAFENLLQISACCARTHLIPTSTHTTFKERDHAACVMRNNFEVGMTIKGARKHKSRHCSRGFIGPPKGPPNLIFRLLFRQIICEICTPRRMHPDRLSSACHILKERVKLGQIKRLAHHIGEYLHANRAKIFNITARIFDHLLRIGHDRRADKTGEASRVLLAKFSHTIGCNRC